MTRRPSPSQQDPWSDWPALRDRWAYRFLVIIIYLWSLTVSVGLIAFIVTLFQND